MGERDLFPEIDAGAKGINQVLEFRSLLGMCLEMKSMGCTHLLIILISECISMRIIPSLDVLPQASPIRLAQGLALLWVRLLTLTGA